MVDHFLRFFEGVVGPVDLRFVGVFFVRCDLPSSAKSLYSLHAVNSPTCCATSPVLSVSFPTNCTNVAV